MTFSEIIPGLLAGKKYSWEPLSWYVFIGGKKLSIQHIDMRTKPHSVELLDEDLAATDWEEV